MPLDQHNSIIAKAMFFSLFDIHLLQPKRCFLPYRNTSNAFFRDLPESSFVFHSSLLTVNSVNLVVACTWWLLLHNGNRPGRIICIFHRGYLDYYWFVLLCNELSIADREGKWILQFQMITTWGAQHRHIFHRGYFDYRRTFRTVLDSYCCVTGWTSQTKNCNGYFTLRYNWGTKPLLPYDAECVGSSVSQYYYLPKKLTN